MSHRSYSVLTWHAYTGCIRHTKLTSVGHGSMKSPMHVCLDSSLKSTMWRSYILGLRWKLSFLLVVKTNHYFRGVIQIVLVYAFLWVVKLFIIFSIWIYVFLVLYVRSEGIVDSLASRVRHCPIISVEFTSKVTNCTSILFLSNCT